VDCWCIQRGHRPRGPRYPEGRSMTGETPVLGTLADLTAASVERNSLAPREFMLVRMATLIPVDDRLPPISPTPRPPRRLGSPPMISRVIIAVAPIAGTARGGWSRQAGRSSGPGLGDRCGRLRDGRRRRRRAIAATGPTSDGASGSDPGREQLGVR